MAGCPFVWSSLHLLEKSIGVRGPVSISMAKSLEPIVISSLQITRSTNGMEAKMRVVVLPTPWEPSIL